MFTHLPRIFFAFIGQKLSVIGGGKLYHKLDDPSSNVDVQLSSRAFEEKEVLRLATRGHCVCSRIQCQTPMR